jgi:hypothetical protein
LNFARCEPPRFLLFFEPFFFLPLAMTNLLASDRSNDRPDDWPSTARGLHCLHRLFDRRDGWFGL